MEEEQLIAKAIKALMEKLGPVETNRFLSLPHKQRIESLQRHRLWQENLDKEQFFDQVFSQ